MKTPLLPVLALVLWVTSLHADDPTTIYIALSAKERLKQQDWSGSAEISEGRIL
ncbi:MAG: hypothetical protein GXP25_17450, partial [Planctomycetes bacterium]|nr:hypothetical protein [Planctomycetota bacterium]